MFGMNSHVAPCVRLPGENDNGLHPAASTIVGVQSMKPPRITDEAYARIPALLEQGMTKAEIAAMYRVTLGSLKVFYAHRGISPLP